MKEAEIVCLCPSYQIQDLTLSLKKGQVVYVSADSAHSSRDLLRALRVKAVQVRYVERSREVRAAPKRGAAPRRSSTPTPPTTPTVMPSPPSSDTLANPELVAEIASQVEARLRPFLAHLLRDAERDLVQSLKAMLRDLDPSPQTEVPLEEEVESPPKGEPEESLPKSRRPPKKSKK